MCRDESVSVLMPVHNGGDYLPVAIESILNQTFANFEFLIINDGSTDGSGALLGEVATRETRIRIVDQDHRGCAAALNHGLAVATGTIIVRMDADDIAAPERIKRLVEFLAIHRDVAAVGSAMRLVDDRGHPKGTAVYPLGSIEIARSLAQGDCALAHPTVAMRRAPIIAVGGYRAQFTGAEDYDLWLRLSEQHPLANLPEVLLDHRCHGGSVSLVYRHEQALAAHCAKLAARQRRSGSPDPTKDLDKLTISAIERFDLAAAERASILIDLADAAQISFAATGSAMYLADLEDALYALGIFRDQRAIRLGETLASDLLKKGEIRRSMAALSWTLRCRTARHIQRQGDDTVRSALPTIASRKIGKHLVRFADPESSREPEHGHFTPREVMQLIAEADAHGVLPALMRNFPRLNFDPTYSPARSDALQRKRLNATLSMMLRHHGNAIMLAASGLPVAMVKGDVFARRLYADPSLRPFTDIDLLAAPEGLAPLAEILKGHGFKLSDETNSSRQEWKWVHRDNEALLVEVHTNLVHAASLRERLSLTYEDIGGVAESPAALLMVAILHGGLHQFERLRQVVDICQAARKLSSGAEERQFYALTAQTGGRFAAITGLRLAYRLFAEPRCREIARALGHERNIGIARLLIDRAVVTSTMNSTRFLHSWRRQGYRELLKRSTGPIRPRAGSPSVL